MRSVCVAMRAKVGDSNVPGKFWRMPPRGANMKERPASKSEVLERDGPLGQVVLRQDSTDGVTDLLHREDHGHSLAEGRMGTPLQKVRCTFSATSAAAGGAPASASPVTGASSSAAPASSPP